jgi:hypothetical protein
MLTAMPAMAIPLTIAPALDQNTFHQIRTRLALDHCKWDPQVGDRPALFPQALLLDSHTWDDLADWSEAMAGEISEAETELACRPDLQRTLSVPRSLRWVLKRGLREGFTASPAVRIAGRSLAACDHCRNLQEHLPGTV